MWLPQYQRTETPNFLGASNLNPYIDNEMRGVLDPVEYRTKTGGIFSGYRAQLLRMVCNIYLQARRDKVLTDYSARASLPAAI